MLNTARENGQGKHWAMAIQLLCGGTVFVKSIYTENLKPKLVLVSLNRLHL